MRVIPEIETLRILASANERDMFSAHIEMLQAKIQLLAAKRDVAQADVRNVMVRNGLDPEKHAVVTRKGDKIKFCTVVNAADGTPVEDSSSPPEIETTQEPEETVVMDKANGHEVPSILASSTTPP
jgi:hypothetical protein